MENTKEEPFHPGKQIDNCFFATNPLEESWENEFDKEFLLNSEDQYFLTRNAIKSFIRSHFIEKAKIQAEIEKWDTFKVTEMGIKNDNYLIIRKGDLEDIKEILK